MDINLCYIEGISFSDNMYFNKITTRNTYFSSKVVKTVSSSFYPPYYRNIIKIEVDNLNTPINYLYYDYLGIRYFYFINDVRYVNETVISIHLTIDTYQTFYYYASFKYAFIEREFVNRWIYDTNTSKYYINRKGYKRECPNAGDNQLIYNKVYYKGSDFSLTYSDNEYPIYVVKRPTGNPRVCNLQYTIKPDTAYNSTLNTIDAAGFNLGVLNDSKSLQIRESTSSGYSSYGPYKSMNELSNFMWYEGTQDIYVFPYGVEEVLVGADNKCTAYPYQNHEAKGAMDVTTLIVAPFDYDTNVSPYNIQPLSSTIQIPSDYRLNSYPVRTEHKFSFKDCPCLWDENYYNITFGDLNVYSTLPLYRTNGMSINVNYLPVLHTGARIYWFTYDSEYNLQTAVINTDPIKLSMVKDPDKDWFQNNKGTIMSIGLTAVGTLLGAVIGNAPGALVGGALGGVGGKALAAGTDTTSYTFEAGSTMNVQPPLIGMNNGSFKYDIGSPNYAVSAGFSKGRDYVDADWKWADSPTATSSSNIAGTIGFMALHPNRLVSAATRSAAEVFNTIGMPPQTRGVGLYCTDALSSAHYCRINISACNNLEAAGMYFHLNGYKTDRVIYTNPIVACNTRTNYFIVKLHEVELSFSILVPQVMQDTFKRILIQGIRLWKTNYPTHKIDYDNLEVSF